jgi:hypothetical protein
VAAHLALVVVVGLLGRSAALHPDDLDRLLVVLCWCGLAAMGLKLLGAGWVVRQARRRGLLEARAAGVVLALWALGVTCLVALCWLLVPPGGPVGVAALAAVLALPLARPLAVPLAVAWNRHR